MADDIDIEVDRMKSWTPEECAAYFESGGEDVPAPIPYTDKLLTTCLDLLTVTGLTELTEVTGADGGDGR